MEWAAPEPSWLSQPFADHQARSLAWTGLFPQEWRLVQTAEALAETAAWPGQGEASWAMFLEGQEGGACVQLSGSAHKPLSL